MWVTKLLISPVKKRILCPKTTKFSPKLALLSIAGSFGALLVGWLVVVARAVSRKTPIYFMVSPSQRFLQSQLKLKVKKYLHTSTHSRNASPTFRESQQRVSLKIYERWWFLGKRNPDHGLESPLKIYFLSSHRWWGQCGKNNAILNLLSFGRIQNKESIGAKITFGPPVHVTKLPCNAKNEFMIELSKKVSKTNQMTSNVVFTIKQSRNDFSNY